MAWTKAWRLAGTQRVMLGAATVLAIVCAAATGGCDRADGHAASPAARTAPAMTPLDLSTAAVIGASVSAGAEVTLPGLKPKMMQGDATLADVLGVIATGGSTGPAGFADMMFFARPDTQAEKQLAAAKAKSPSMVFAIDYLFWHAYGAPMSDSSRRAAFDKGLARLDQLSCPIVVADLPDMSHAVGMMLMAPQVPSVAIQEELNKKLEAWAAERPRVLLVKLREVVRSAMKNEPVTLGGVKLTGEQARGLLTPSGLHTTADGSILLALECLQRLRAAGVIAPTSTWDTDVAVIKDRLVKKKLAEEQAAAASSGAPAKK